MDTGEKENAAIYCCKCFSEKYPRLYDNAREQFECIGGEFYENHKAHPQIPIRSSSVDNSTMVHNHYNQQFNVENIWGFNGESNIHEMMN